LPQIFAQKQNRRVNPVISAKNSATTRLELPFFLKPKITHYLGQTTTAVGAQRREKLPLAKK
jgi:hypothetical protein